MTLILGLLLFLTALLLTLNLYLIKSLASQARLLPSCTAGPVESTTPRAPRPPAKPTPSQRTGLHRATPQHIADADDNRDRLMEEVALERGVAWLSRSSP